jgi:DNA cross-link repair 1A protein
LDILLCRFRDVADLDVCWQYCFPAQPQVIEACASLARRTVFGFGAGTAADVGDEADVKPFLVGLQDADKQERGKRMMESWLVKEEEDVKLEQDIGEDAAVVKKKGRTLVIMG